MQGAQQIGREDERALSTAMTSRSFVGPAAISCAME
jgi:hypothetical protein